MESFVQSFGADLYVIETFYKYLDEPMWNEGTTESRAIYLFEAAREVWALDA
jgi:hypothetical protein